MINSEKSLEDYICNNQKEFMQKLKDLYGDYDIQFLGRQVKIGNENIADLIYFYTSEAPEPIAKVYHYIVVELKFRQLTPQDLSQLTRYVLTLQEKLSLSYDEEIFVSGTFVSFGCNDAMQEIQMINLNPNINFLRIKNKIFYEEESYSYKEEYLDNLKLDRRFLTTIEGSNE